MQAISRLATAFGLAVAVALVTAAPASAGVAQPAEVSTDPADVTPDVDDGAVYKVLQVGDTLYAGGSFSSVTKGATVARRNLFSFDVTTGAVHAFAPKVDGVVWALASDAVRAPSSTRACRPSQRHTPKMSTANSTMLVHMRAG